MYSADKSTPCEAEVDADSTYLIVAPGATAPDHCVSRSASPSSSVEVSPGSSPLYTMLFASNVAGNPNTLRNCCTSLTTRFVSPTIATVCPLPLQVVAGLPHVAGTP